MSESIKTGAGATPAGAVDEQSAARAVQQMFDEIATRYDFLTHALSMNIDRLWWRRTAKTFQNTLSRPDCCVLDLCAGTGDMSVALRKVGPEAKVFALDFSHAMLCHGTVKFARRKIQPLEADALTLPLRDNSLDLVVSAFGFRNLANSDAGLREFFRVLKRKGAAAILDFSEPGGLMGKLYGFYFRQVLPRIGTLISGLKGPYEYLPASVHKFPSPSQMLRPMEIAGFSDTSWTPYTFGIAGLYRAKKSA